ncbi:MAG: hypothetical protein R2809_02640 [Flavobacteriales bacterium]
MLTVFRILSIIGSAGMILAIFLHLAMQEGSLEFFDYLQMGMVVFLSAQLIYVLSTSKLISGKKYHDLETIDTAWAYEEKENQQVISNNMFLISMAVMGGLVWLYFLFVFAITIRYLPGLDYSDTKAQIFLVAIVSQFLGAVPSVIYNVRTWNKSVLA